MKIKKVYNIVKIFTSIFIAALFILIDCVILSFQDYILYLIFIPLEVLFILLWIFIIKFNSKVVMRINTNKGVINIITYGGDYTVNAGDITVKPGSFYYLLLFNDIKLRANSSSKSVAAFLHKYQNIYRKIEKVS